MSKKTIALLVVGTILFCAVQFGIRPKMKAKEPDFAKMQDDSLTHDISAVMKYRSRYVGDNSNTVNLFYALPLNSIGMKFEIHTDERVLTVNYLETAWDIGEEKVHRDLIYNSVAAMALIDNLAGVTYNFSGDSFSFSRETIQSVFGQDLSRLLEGSNWKSSVQGKLKDGDFVMQFYGE